MQNEESRSKTIHLLELPKSIHQSIVRMNVRGQTKSGTNCIEGLVGTIKVPDICTTQYYAI